MILREDWRFLAHFGAFWRGSVTDLYSHKMFRENGATNVRTSSRGPLKKVSATFEDCTKMPKIAVAAREQSVQSSAAEPIQLVHSI
jgi:hypothetical protein